MVEKSLAELKQELINLIIEYEHLERKKNLLNQVYILEFHEVLEQQRYLLSENEYLLKAMSMFSNGKSIDEIKEFLENCKKQFSSLIFQFQKDYELANAIHKQCLNYSKEDMETFEEELTKYCSSYHPFIRVYVTEFEQTIYQTLISLYRMGNLKGFMNVIKENQDFFSQLKESNDTKELMDQYILTQKELKEMIKKNKENYPLNQEEMFYKEESMTRELMRLREKNYKAREMNQSLQKDFKLHFDFPFSL